MSSIKMLAVFPIIIMFILIFIQLGATFSASGQTLCINNPNTNSECTSGNQVVVSCPSTSTSPCIIQNTLAQLFTSGLINFKLPTYCSSAIQQIFGPNPPPPAYCGTTLGLYNGIVYLNPGNQVVVSAGSSIAPASTSVLSYVFTDITYSNYGFIAMVVVALGLVALAGITVFGSSPTSTESAHILFVAGLMVALWIILSVAEGFVVGRPTSFLTELNSITIDGTTAQLGTTTYVLLTLVEVVGVVGLISRGE